MLVRIVKMTFKKDEINTFKKIFKESQPLIKNFPGCRHVILLQDKLHENVMFTLSHWESLTHLDEYRSSNLFEATWARTKILFDAKPEAWSMEEVEDRI
jgi:heme-degrading monooxygenase HmoA